MANTLRKSGDCLAVRYGEVRLGADVRSEIKNVLIELAADQQRPLKAVVGDALTDYVRLHWQREQAPVL